MRILILALVFMGIHSACDNANEYCSGCEADSAKCSYCVASYISEGVCTAPPQTLDFCYSYKSATECLVCQFGYFLNDAGACQEIQTPDCAIYNKTTDKCTVCKDKMVAKTDGTCSSDNACEVSNCSYCETVGGLSSCILCDKGYMALPGSNGVNSCLKETSSVTNCERVDSAHNLKCAICDNGYYNLKGSCLVSSKYTISKQTHVLSKLMILWVLVLNLWVFN